MDNINLTSEDRFKISNLSQEECKKILEAQGSIAFLKVRNGSGEEKEVTTTNVVARFYCKKNAEILHEYHRCKHELGWANEVFQGTLDHDSGAKIGDPRSSNALFWTAKAIVILSAKFYWTEKGKQIISSAVSLVRSKNNLKKYFNRAVYFSWAGQLVLYGGGSNSQEVQFFAPHIPDEDIAKVVLEQVCPGLELVIINDR